MASTETINEQPTRTSNGGNLIHLEGVTKVFLTDEVETHALSGIHLDIRTGEYISIAGPSGCGKSTLLSILGLLDSPTEGEYSLDGTPVARLTPSERARIRNRQVGFIFQSFNLVDELSVRENIELALLYHDVPASERRSRVEAVMDKVGVAHRAKHRPSQLSGGQQQRVAVARALVGNPKLILADEPTGNLDTQHGEEVMKMLQALNREGSTIVMVTHSPAHADYAGRVVNMLDGRILIERRRAA
jgi:putative ABC transport system ATP-binding protein